MSSYAMMVDGEIFDRVTIKQVRARFPDIEADDFAELEAFFAEAELSMADTLGLFAVADPADGPPDLAEGETIDVSAPIEREDGSWGRDWIVHRELEVFAPGKGYARINGPQQTYPYTYADFRADRPDVATRQPPFKQIDGEWGIVEVEAVAAPETGPEQIAELDGIEFVDGCWREAWQLRDRSAEELQAARDGLWASIMARRDAESQGIVETPLGAVQADPASLQKINGAVTMAMLSQAAQQPYAVKWTMADNTRVDHDAAAIIAMGVAVAQHVAACHDAAGDIREAIAAAETFAALAAIDIEAGWPSQQQQGGG